MFKPLNTSITLAIAAITAFFSIATYAQETSFLELKEGFTGQKLGAQISDIEILESEDTRKITLEIKELPTSLESIDIVDKKGIKIHQKKRYEVINDPDQNRSGVIIYIGKKHTLPIKLNFNEDANENTN